MAGRLNSGVRPLMYAAHVPLSSIANEVSRLLRAFLPLVLLVGALFGVLSLWLGQSRLLWTPVVVAFALLFVAAPMATSAVRARRRVALFTSQGAKTLVICFTWGSCLGVLFIAALQLGQGNNPP